MSGVWWRGGDVTITDKSVLVSDIVNVDVVNLMVDIDWLGDVISSWNCDHYRL